MKKRAQSKQDGEQERKFLEAARTLGCDEDPTRFDEALKKVARHKPAKDGGNAVPPPIAPEPHKEGK